MSIRSSNRLRGIQADSEIAKRKADEDAKNYAEIQQAKRARVSGDLKLVEIKIENDRDGKDTMVLLDTVKSLKIEKPPIAPPKDADFKALQKEIGKLEIRHTWPTVKVTPDRIYSVALHPSAEKMIGFAGDKNGVLGVWEIEGEKEPFEEGEEVEPVVNSFQVHSRRTISSLQFRPTDHTKILTGAYDGSVRQLDLTSGISSEVLVLPQDRDALICSMQCAPDGYSVWASDIGGRIFHRDIRTPMSINGDGEDSSLDMYHCHERKIGGISLNQAQPHLICTASLDKTMRIWDMRKMAGGRNSRHPTEIFSYEHRLSVSCAYWSPRGNHIVTTSYDDHLRIFDFDTVAKWNPGQKVDAEPSASISHNNQTGRWLTLFRSLWHPSASVRPHFLVGNMTRAIDVYDYTGAPLAQLRDSDKITAVSEVSLRLIYANSMAGTCGQYVPPHTGAYSQWQCIWTHVILELTCSCMIKSNDNVLIRNSAAKRKD